MTIPEMTSSESSDTASTPVSGPDSSTTAPETSPEPQNPAPKKRGRPRKNSPTEDGAPATPKKRGRPRKSQEFQDSQTASYAAEDLIDTETATLDRYQQEPLPEPEEDPSEEEMRAARAAVSASYHDPDNGEEEETADGSAPAVSTDENGEEAIVFGGEEEGGQDAGDTPAETEGSDDSADIMARFSQSVAGLSATAPSLPADSPAEGAENIGPQTEPKSQLAAAIIPGAVPPDDIHPGTATRASFPDADPALFEPSEALKAALASPHPSRFDIRRLTRRERAFLRTVQHGAKFDYATFVARGLANAQKVALIQHQNGKGGAPAQGFPNVPTAPAAAFGAGSKKEMPRVEPAPPRPQLPALKVTDLQSLDVKILLAKAEETGLADELPSLHKHDVVFELLRHHARRGGAVIAEGVLEIMKDGNGFLRNRFANYHTSPEDAQVPVAMIKRLALRPGDLVSGPCRAPAENAPAKSRYFVLTDVNSVNGLTPAQARRITPFENQTPLFPNRRIKMETAPNGIEMRIVDLFTPVGFGQRGLIVAPPRTGKTILMQKMANAISENHPDAYLIILLIVERPEEVTDMQRTTKAHVISSTFDEPPERHVQVADIVIEMARRRVEMGEDVVILLDSITRLARAYNTLSPTNGTILSGGVYSTALQKPKRFFGSARNIEHGGSLTIIATALVDTGSRMDEVIFEEFKGTGNMEICLDRSLVDKRVFPAINIAKSGTRKEELLVGDDALLSRTWAVRRAVTDVPPVEAMEMVVSRMKKTASNIEFLLGVQNTD